MRNNLTICLLILVIGCKSRSSEQATNGSAETQTSEKTTASTTPDTLCFQKIMSRDTTTLQLVINGEQATGYLDSKPYEKDRARGPFQGTINGSKIGGDWQRSGEGTTQPYTLDFTLQGDTISWHEGERIERQGKWVLKSLNTGYQNVLAKINCSKSPLR
ncbi:hypothetical protein [Spirosoma flavum]|uniref:Lipoprotein n=1 Tax=Spirosoma flavum TaxID=2048557 RepID=A0ABW6AFB1_9BACT